MAIGKTIKDALGKKISTISADDNLHKALEVMARDNVTALLVKMNGSPVGIITITDIMYSLAKDEEPREVKVSSFMTKCELISTRVAKTPCVQLDQDYDLLAAIKVMNEAGVNHVLVSGGNGEPVGMISSLEIAKLLVS